MNPSYIRNRSRAESNIRQGQAGKAMRNKGKSPRPLSQPQSLLLFIINLTNFTFSLAACGPVKNGRHLVAYDLFDISVMVSFALLL